MRVVGTCLVGLATAAAVGASACAKADDVRDGAAAADANTCRDEPWFESIEVTCDERDNDCDGTVDNVPGAPVWYADADGDGYGDPADTTATCTMPAGHVGNDDDCDDGRYFRHPGLAETCDGVDNDCASTTTETCPTNCTAQINPADGHSHMFCDVGALRVNAHNACVAQNLLLVRIDSATDNGWVRATATTLFGGADQLWLGGTDVAEGTWLWDDGEPFWMGGGNGVALGGHYTNWAGDEPNDDGTEDCADMRSDGQWNDGNCGNSRPYVCERLDPLD